MCRNISGECGCPGSVNADSLQGATWQSPLGIGTVAPAAGVFTTVNALTSLTTPIGNITTANSTTTNTDIANVTTKLNSLDINVSSLTPGLFVATDGGNNLISVVAPTTIPSDTAPTANTLIQRDSDANAYANNFVRNLNQIVTAGGTTNFTTATAQNVLVTGTFSQNIKLPKANDWVDPGASYEINNGSSGLITLLNFGSGVIGTIPTGGYAKVILVDNTSANGVWDIHPYLPSGPTWGTNGLLAISTLATADPTNATSTTTGSIQTLGGVGILKDLWVGGTINAGGLGIKQTTMWHDQSYALVGNPMTTVFNSGNPYAIASRQDPPAINDSFEQGFALDPGNYTLSVLGATGVNRGILSFYIDNVFVGNQDWYLAGSATFPTKTIAITVSGGLPHTIKVIIAAKNASSSDYFAILFKYWIR